MKLRTQVSLAVLLMLIVPLGAIAVLVSARNGGMVPGQALLRYGFLTAWLRGNVVEGPDGRPFLKNQSLPFPEAEIVLFDRAGNLVPDQFSPVQSRVGPEVEDGKRFLWQSLQNRGKAFGSVMVRFPVTRAPGTEDPLDPLDWLLVYLGALVITTVGLGIWLSRVSAQVSRLRRATENLIQKSWTKPVSLQGLPTKEFRDLGEVVETLRQALVSEQQKRARFLAGVSHDLRTPLTAILGYVEAIEDGLADDPETLHRYLAIVRAKGELLGGRLSDLIDYGRMESEDWRPVRVRHDLVAFLEELGHLLEDDGRLLGVTLRCDLPPRDTVFAQFDQALITRALENLINNAFQACPPGAEVILRLTQSQEGSVLSVEDRGPGIAPQDREFLFEPFFRGEGSRKPGHGLGLFITKTILAGHGWSIDIAPTAEGARFLITLPPLERY